jgi:nicotinamidase-related amidase
MKTRTFVSSVSIALLVASQGYGQTPARQPAASAPQQSGAVLLDPKDTIILLLDHQTGLFQTVKDIPVQDLRTNTVVLAKAAELAKAPVITTASEPNGPNGPLMPELEDASPNARYIPRKGEVSAWDNEDFRKAVQASGKKTIVVAGVWTSVCVAFPALQMKAEGYKVYAVVDASGDMSEMASHAAMARMAQAGVIPVSTNAVMAELQRTWARPDAVAWGALYSELVPHYRAATESFQKAQEAAQQRRRGSL